MAFPAPAFSLANLLNGTYGVDTPEEVERVRSEQREEAAAACRNYKPLPAVDVSESVTEDAHSLRIPDGAPSEEVSVEFVTYGAEDYLEKSDDELLVAFETMVKPMRVGQLWCPAFDKCLFISSIAMARALLMAPISSNRTMKCFEDLVAAIYTKSDFYYDDECEADDVQISISSRDVPGYSFEPWSRTSGFEPPPICEACDMIMYQCPCFDFNALKKSCAERTFADDYVIEGLDGVVDNATLLSNLGPFLVPVKCQYEKCPTPAVANPPSLNRATDRVDINLVQSICDSTLPTHSNYDDSFHQVFVESADYSIDLDHVRLRQSDLIAKIPDSGHMIPVLNTGSGHKRVGTTKEVLTAIKKRNADVPELGDSVNLSRLSKAVAERFFISYINGNSLAASNFVNVVSNFHDYMEKWKSSGLSYDDLPDLHAENLQFYDHMIKSDVKPVVSDTLNIDRPVPATITYHKKGITSQFSPLFTALFERFQRCLRERIILPVGKISSLEMLGFDVKNKHCLEIDLSKFDKSQGEFHLMIQEHILNGLGCPAPITKWWCDFHRFSYIRDRRAGVGMPISFQRRTGDAFTYFGNTIVTMAEFAWCYDTDQFEKLLFSGDDSLGFSTLPPVGDPSKFTTLFNMEAKVMEPAVPYICSKFLLSDEFGNTFSVPDPLREVQRLGTKKIPYSDNDEFLFAHFMSFVDRLKFLDRMTQSCIDQLSLFFELKYRKSGAEAALMLGAFKKYTANFQSYKELYYSDRRQCELINSFSCVELRIERSSFIKQRKKKDGIERRRNDKRRTPTGPHGGGEETETKVSQEESTGTMSQKSQREGAFKSQTIPLPTVLSSRWFGTDRDVPPRERGGIVRV
ncbi:2a protein [Cucumber mosaic virus]|uniref:RNA-directed RNA polymerase 2a n=1 Tax=Cucumber mosaic virus TaxID=12305 RepID=R9UJE6_9BROM|nr:2a protein [Cucumber mosaic virus]